MAQNYTLGRGEIYFAPFIPGTQTPTGERYLGNTPEFSLTIEEEKLDHYSSDRGIREKDDSISLQVNRTGQLITDNIDPKNVALFFFGSATALAVTGATVTDEAINDVEQGLHYQLGVTTVNPSGARALDVHTAGPPAKNIIVTVSSTEKAEGTDYTVDMELGRIYIVPGGSIVDGSDLKVSYKTKTSTRQRVISGSAPVTGQLRYIAQNPKGENFDYLMPYVSISPNGDYALKGDEWQQIPFNIEVLKKSGQEAIYMDGRAVYS